MNSRILSLLLLGCLLVACAQRPIQLVTPCANKTTPTIVKDIAAMMAAEGLTLGVINENIGVVQASGDPGGGMFRDARWQVTVRGDTVYATAKMRIQQTDVFMDDKTNEMYQWYWGVRNALERYCGAPIKFVES